MTVDTLTIIVAEVDPSDLDRSFTAEDIVDNYAMFDDAGHVVLDFGAHSITLEGVTTIDGLADILTTV